MNKKVFALISVLLLLFSIFPIVNSAKTNSYFSNESSEGKENINEIETLKITAPSDKSDLPTVNIVKPKDKWLYKNNVAKRPLVFLPTIILGYVTVFAEVNTSDGKTIEKVEFYVDDELKFTDLYKPYTWTWFETKLLHIRKYKIKVVAYDSEGYQNSDEISVFKYKIGFRPILVHPIISSSLLAGVTSIIAGAFLLASILSNIKNKDKTEPSVNENEPEPNKVPLADARGPYKGYINSPMQFDGSSSSDNDGTIISYHWNFGDGNTGQGKIITHIYREEGEYDVKLTVTDNKGGTDDVITKAVVTDSVANNNEVKDSLKTLEKKNSKSLNLVILVFGLFFIIIAGIFIFLKIKKNK